MPGQLDDRAAPFGAVLSLTLTAALGAFLLLAAPALLVIPGKDLPAPLADQHQSAETLLFLAAFVVVLPLSVWLTSPLIDRIAAAQGSAATSALAGVVASTLLATLLSVKLSERLPWGGGLGVLTIAMAIFCISSSLVLARAARVPQWPPLTAVAHRLRPVWLLAAGLLLVTALAFAQLDSIAFLPLVDRRRRGSSADRAA